MAIRVSTFSRSPVLYTLVLQGSAQGLLLLFSMLMARSLPLDEFGEFVFGFQFGQVGASVLALGATFYLAKFFAGFSASKESAIETFKLHNYFLYRGVLVLSAVWMIFALTARSWPSVGSFGISIVNFSAVTLMSFYTAVGKAPLGNALQAGRGLVLCVSVSVPLIFGSTLDPVLVVLLAASTYAVFTYGIVARRYTYRIASHRPVGQYELARQHVYSVVFAGVDVIVLKFMSGPNEVAIYGVAFFLSSIASFALYAVNANYTAKISRALRDNDDIATLLRYVARINLLLSIPFLAILILFALNLTIFYGSDFEASKDVFLILLVGQFVNVFVGSVALVANVAGYERNVSNFILQSLVFKIAVGAFAAAYFGAIGFAVVACMANALWNLRTFALVFFKLGLNTSVVRL